MDVHSEWLERFLGIASGSLVIMLDMQEALAEIDNAARRFVYLNKLLEKV